MNEDTPWRLAFTRQAQKDAKKLAASNLRPKAEALPELLREDPFTNPPSFKPLAAKLTKLAGS